jgi:short-subunit dehydrogenase
MENGLNRTKGKYNISHNNKYMLFLSIFLLYKSIKMISLFKQYFLTKPKNFPVVYGKKWVMITGSSQGIGLSFAKKFASLNFNILVTGRNESNLKLVQSELYKINSNCIVEYLISDHSKSEFPEELKSKLSKYEIAILVNNVGVFHSNYFHKMPIKDVQEIINTNILNTSLLTHVILEKMMKRQQKSLIVCCGSDLSLYNPPYSQVYNASKSYLKTLMLSLAKENEKVDFTYLEIGPVYTPNRMNKIPFKINSDDFVDKSMSQIGNYNYSHGHYLHALKYLIFGNNLIYNLYTKKNFEKEFRP